MALAPLSWNFYPILSICCSPPLCKFLFLSVILTATDLQGIVIIILKCPTSHIWCTPWTAHRIIHILYLLDTLLLMVLYNSLIGYLNKCYPEVLSRTRRSSVVKKNVFSKFLYMISFSLLSSPASTQLNSTSTQTKAEVSLTSTFSSHWPTRPATNPPTHPARTVVSKTSSVLLHTISKTTPSLLQDNPKISTHPPTPRKS